MPIRAGGDLKGFTVWGGHGHRECVAAFIGDHQGIFRGVQEALGVKFRDFWISVRNRALWAENRKIWLAREFRTP